MVQIRITNISGATYPIEVYISDVYGNNRSYLVTIPSGPVPPELYYNTIIPSIFETAPEVMLTLIDAVGCERIEIVPCSYNPIIILYAYLTIEPYSSRTSFNSWMSSQGSNWRGYNINSPSIVQSTFESEMSNYLNYPGWGSSGVPAIRSEVVPQSTGGLDSQGNTIVQYKFLTHEVPSSLIPPNEYCWYTWFVPVDATNGEKYDTIGQGVNPNSLTNFNMNPVYSNLIVNYTGTAIPQGTYRVYNTYGIGDFNIANLNNNLYFRGGSLVP